MNFHHHWKWLSQKISTSELLITSEIVKHWTIFCTLILWILTSNHWDLRISWVTVRRKHQLYHQNPCATGGTATSDRDGKGKCARCLCDLFECESKEVKELLCKHYCQSSCMVLLYEIEWEEAYCQCRSEIPSNWLKKTVDEIKEHMAYAYINCSTWTIGTIGKHQHAESRSMSGHSDGSALQTQKGSKK